MQLTFKTVLLILISSQSFLFAFILFSIKSPKKTSNLFLGSFLMVIGIQMVLIYLSDFYQNLQPFNCVFGFLYGVLLYHYTYSLIFRKYKPGRYFMLHFIPAFLFFITPLFQVYLCYKIGWMIYISLISYVAFSISEINKYRKIVKHQTSTNQSIDLSWLIWTMVIFTIILVADIIQYVIPENSNSVGINLMEVTVLTLLLFMVNGMFYKGIKQPQIFLGISLSGESESPKENRQLKPISLEEITRIEAVMEKDQPYLNPTLFLQELANQIGFSPRQLSQIINSHYKQNFIDFINTYRIEKAKERLKNPKDNKETILEVMYEVGFNSKSSFNTIFKAKTGLTPSQYKKKLLS